MSTAQQTLVIAEAGVNHNGDLEIAKKLVDAASEAGANVIKFQTYQASQLATEQAEQAAYQTKALNQSEGQLAMLKRLELQPEHHAELINYCRKQNIEFLSSAFDMSSIGLLASLKLKRWKVPSGEITNLPYLRQIGSQGKPVILSTGMANLGEIEAAITALEAAGTPRTLITVLHCNTEYPTPMPDVNLLAMGSIRNAFKVAVGYSDHTLGIEVPIAAVTLGAKVIEKHLTLDRNSPGPDHQASLEPHEFAAMVIAIRNIEKALGDGIKRASSSEQQNIAVVRKSLVASRFIRAGETFSSYNVTTKRPGTGISPMHWDEVMGCQSDRDYEADELIQR